MSAKRTLYALLFLIALAVPSIVRAAPEPTKTATASMLVDPSKREGWEPIGSGKAKAAEVDPNPLVVGAYAVFFVCMFGYVVFVARGQAAIAKEMKDLAERIKRMEKK